MTEPIILSIDTSCDETCAAVSCGRRILSNVISSQINLHAPYGGVVPHLAKLAHQDKIEWVIKEAIKRALKKNTPGVKEVHTPGVKEVHTPGVKFTDLFRESLDAIAVTVGPGLAPALEVGVSYAKNLALKLTKPLIAVNHMEGHLLSGLAERNTPFTPGVKEVHTPGVKLLPNKPGLKDVHKPGLEPSLPALGLLASGGHTQLILVKSIGNYELLGETLDDAAGEALDKLAKMLKLGYPGGPIIEQLAKLGQPDSIPLPIPLQHSKDFNFSFSGLKTAAMYKIKSVGSVLTVKFTHNMAAAFQQAIAKSLNLKLQKAIDQYSPKTILLGGGVFSNLYFRGQIRSAKQNLPLYIPYSKKLFTDNAAMICIPAYYKFLKKEFVDNIAALDRQPSLSF